MGIPIGRLADRYPRRTVMAVCVALWSAMTALSGAARGFATLLACRVGVGIGEAGCSPPAISMISDYVPAEKRGGALSLYSMAVPAGIVIGFLAGGYLREIIGWRMAFVVVGLPGILVAALLLLTVREPPRQAQTSLPPAREVFAFLWARRSFRYLALASGLYAFATYSTSFMLALFLERSHGLSAVQQGQAAAFIMAGGVGVGTFAGGFIADAWAKHDRRAYALLPMISMAIAVPGSAAAFLCEHTPLAIGLLMIPGLCGQIYQAPAFAASQSREPVSTSFTVALAPKKLGYKTRCAGNSGSIAKHRNAVDGLFGSNPKGRWLFSRISALLVAHLATAKPRSSRLELRENSRRRNHE